MFAKKNLWVLILMGIFLLAFLLRFYKLSEFPVGFHQDEASLGYNAYSLLTTGKDENGNFLPLYIDMFGDNRPSGYHFLTVLPVALFGLTEFATRFSAAFFGTLSIFPAFFLALLIFKKREIALLFSFLTAIAPWHTVLSRASAEAIIALFFVLFGFYFILKSFEEHKVSSITVGTLLLTVSFFFYHTPRVFVPLLFLTILVFYIKTWYKTKFRLPLLFSFFIVSFVAVSLALFVKGGTGRFKQVNIFSFPETRLVMEEQIREDGVNGTTPLLTRVFHNKLINYSFTFINNYSEYFTGQFLFTKGGLPIWYQVPAMGLIYIVELPFFLTGVYFLFQNKSRWARLPLLWLLVAPLTAALTVDDIPNINRASVLFPMVDLTAAFGFVTTLLEWRRFRPALLLTTFLFLLFHFSYFLHQYFVHAKQHRTWYRNNGFKEMISEMKKVYNNYDVIVLNKSYGGMYPAILFYMPIDPSYYQKIGSTKDRDYSKIGKIFFTPQGCPSISLDPSIPGGKKLYIDRGDCPTREGLKDFTYIYREDGTRAFRIVYSDYKALSNEKK